MMWPWSALGALRMENDWLRKRIEYLEKAKATIVEVHADAVMRYELPPESLVASQTTVNLKVGET